MTPRALLDTNILLDMMSEARPGYGQARRLLELASAGRLTLCVAATSLKDVSYISRKFVERGSVGLWLDFFLDEFEVLALDRRICLDARASGEPDFEDGIIRAIAERNLVDTIVSRDQRAFSGSRVRKMSAGELADLVCANE